MPSINLTDPVNGTVTDASVIASNNQLIEGLVNGGLDDTNISSAAAILISKLAGFPNDPTKVLLGDGSWASGPGGGGSGGSSGTVFPPTPTDGQTFDYLADSANGVIWRFKYRAASASTYKWEFIGGSALHAEVATDQTTATTGWTDLPTVGPQVTIPIDGDWDIQANVQGYSTVNAGQNMRCAIKIGSNAVVEPTDSFSTTGAGAGSTGLATCRAYRKLGLAAATVIKMQYLIASGSHWQNRVLRLTPVRVKG